MARDVLEEQIRTYFLMLPKNFTTDHGVSITISVGGVCFIKAVVKYDDQNDRSYQLYDEIDGIGEFVDEYNIHSMDELRSIDKPAIWKRYLQEKAEVLFTNQHDQQICFRPFRGRTTIYSTNLSYYTEVWRLMDTVEDIEEWVDENTLFIEEISGVEWRGK
jgi:hypothetical protein